MKTVLLLFLVLLIFLVRLQFLPKLNLSDGQRVRVTGVLSGEPQASGNQQQFKIGQFTVWTKRYPEFHYGESMTVVGKVKITPQYFFNLPLTSFNKFSISAEKIERLEIGRNINFVNKLALDLRVKLLGIYNQTFSKPLDGIVSGIVIGDKSLIPEEFWSKLQQTGTLHIMVASGMNIAMFSNGLLAIFLLLLKRRVAIVCLLSVIWFYSIMTGLSPPMVRAATMASLIYLSQLLGRETEGGRVLAITGILMIIVDPSLLVDVGFQLSFLATGGLVYIQPKLKKSKFFLLRYENFSSSVASQLATLPVLISCFGQINLLSPLINLIILWTIPFILQLGIGVGILGLLWINLAKLASYLAFPILFFLEQAISAFAKITWFQIQLPKTGWIWAVMYYFFLWRWLRRGIKNNE